MIEQSGKVTFEQNDIFSELYPKFKIDKPVRLIELFAGIGSQAKALKNIGVPFEHWKAVEIDKYAMASYNAVHGTEFQTTGIKEIHAANLEIVERESYCYILTYSFPCTDLSLAGHMMGMERGSGTRSSLLWEVERILEECGNDLPQVLLMENVPQVIGEKNIASFQEWRNKLERLGYQNYSEILNAADYGIPQARERCFMVSVLGEYSYTFPRKCETKLRLGDILEDEISEKFLVKEEKLKKLVLSSDIDEENNYRIIQVGNYIDDTHRKFKNPNRGRVYSPKGLCPTLTTMEGGDLVPKIYENPERVRILMPKESWKLMGFTVDDFAKAEKVNSNTQLYKQAGNSIVVQVLEAIFKEMTRET